MKTGVVRLLEWTGVDLPTEPSLASSDQAACGLLCASVQFTGATLRPSVRR